MTTKTLPELAAAARELANALFSNVENECSQPEGKPGCCHLEGERPLTTQERSRGLTRRPFWAYDPERLCRACLAYWHVELAAQALHEADCWRIRIEAEEARKAAREEKVK